jgi:hypothetical protein
MATTSLTSVGGDAGSPEPSEGCRLRLAMRPKFLTYQIHIWAMMLENFHISSPKEGLDPHLAPGCWEGTWKYFHILNR